ncbi:MAG: hypothetical protein R3B70_02320 [Polyangiaceae bacterium]
MADWEKKSQTGEWVIYVNKDFPRVHISARSYDVSDAHSTYPTQAYTFHYFKDGSYSGNPSAEIRTTLMNALDDFLRENRALLNFAKKGMFSTTYDDYFT